MNLRDDLVDRSVEEGARVVALALLVDADEAATRLHDRADSEALHDLRVGLRRTRTTLRAFRAWLADERKREKKLRKYAKSTNAARDAEVELAWLETQRDCLAHARHGAAVDFLAEWIRTHADAPDAEELVARYRRTSRKLARALGSYTQRVEPGHTTGQVTFGLALAALLDAQLDVLHERIDAIQDALDEPTVHQARIAAKRLRYLLEPLRGNRHADARDAVKLLKRLQDVLGDLHDAHVLAHRIGEALADSEAERARRLHAAVYGSRDDGAAIRGATAGSPRRGLLSILRLVRERRDALFADLEREWRGEHFEVLGSAVRALSVALEARAGGKLERERKYLLAAVPPRAQESAAIEIDQGWLPGTQLHERIRRMRDADGERFWRGVKQGTGEARLEAEEETTREVFAVLWPLTEGRRVSKRRRKLSDAGLVWEIDEFTDRALVLAEVELPAGTGRLVLPEWLGPVVQREVTDDPAFRNENLARANPPAAPPEPATEGGTVAEPATEGGTVAEPVPEGETVAEAAPESGIADTPPEAT
jgi:CHAD domain-containing protein/CYTH domain-containing protein